MAYLGIELGSTRIKAVLIDDRAAVLASGSHTWENRLVDGLWSYSLDDVWEGLHEAYASLVADFQAKHGSAPRVDGIGVSAMMHGYLVFDTDGELLTPFRTWRNTNTAEASAALTAALDFAVPQRWSIAHLYQAVSDGEEHVPGVAFMTTLAGYVHWQLTGEKVLGVGDASGMFPIAGGSWDEARLGKAQRLFDAHGAGIDLAGILPEVLPAGRPAGRLSAAGAKRLDPTGNLQAGVPLCPPEGDAGTGMVATNAVAPRTGNVSVGTSVFAMIVLERPLAHLHQEIDVVTTPAGDPVAMVHCNNGASEIDAWAHVFAQFAHRVGADDDLDNVFQVMFGAALDGEADGGGLLAYNYLAGEPVTGLPQGNPLIVRPPDSRLSLANFVRTLIDSSFATLALGMRILADENVGVDAMFAHGGVFKTKAVAQRLLAAALKNPVTVGQTAGEGGAWGMAVLAAYAARVAEPASGAVLSLGDYLKRDVFADATVTTLAPEPADVAGFEAFLARFEAGLAIERATIGETAWTKEAAWIKEAA